MCVQVSLAGLWLMPAIISLQLRFWRFLVIWAAYSLVTGYLMALCSTKKMHHSTPRKVCVQPSMYVCVCLVHVWGVVTMLHRVVLWIMWSQCVLCV